MADRWQYSDYITLEGAARLTRLRLHIQEVSNFTQGTSTRGKSMTAVDPQYLGRLQKMEEELATRLNTGSSGSNFARNNLAFRRD